jgi:hypothetical protein
MAILRNIQQILEGNTAAGIHLMIQDDGKWQMQVVVMEKRKNKLHLKGGYSEIATIEELLNFMHNDYPVILSVDGKGTIHRKVDDQNQENPLFQVLPQAKPADFFTQTEFSEDRNVMVSLIRKSLINEILDAFAVKGFNIYSLMLGPFSLNALWQLINKRSDTFSIGQYEIQIHNCLIQDLSHTSKAMLKEIAIGNEHISSELIIPYGNSISFFLANECSLSYSEDITRSTREEFLYKKAFKYFSYALPLLLFIILFINYILFNSYNTKFTRSDQQYQAGLELLDQLDSLTNELHSKETLIEQAGLTQETRFAYYADRIAASVPLKVKLINMEIDPLISELKQEKAPDPLKSIIKINGTCSSGLNLDEWIHTLSSEEWIEQIEIVEYVQTEKSLPGQFTIQIEY